MTMLARRQAILLTFGAIALIAGLHVISSAPALNHLDFIPGGLDAQEFCDPRSSNAIELAKSPPAILVLTPAAVPTAGRTVEMAFTLRTATGKPITSADLLLVGSRKVHLRIVGPSSQEVRTVASEDDRKPDEWRFEFMPQSGGTYRVVAEFTPVATGREITSSAPFTVAFAGAPR